MAFNQLKTPWTDKVGDKPWQEYPRPQFRRDSYVNLNGIWHCAFTTSESLPSDYPTEILVPFSPETVLSRVQRILQPNEFLHYRTTFVVTEEFDKGVILLHFGAVDSIAKVFVNGKYVGMHVGGYNPFCMDISDQTQIGENVLQVVVQDFSDSSYYTNGKQNVKRGGMWYTPQSGIWQTVWLESVAPCYVESVRLTPLFDKAQLQIDIVRHGEFEIRLTALAGGNEVCSVTTTGNRAILQLPEDFQPWSPESPFLYDLEISSQSDFVKSYFAMRKFSIEKDDNGYLRTYLNNKPYFHNGLLDQGYWSDGLYTAPCDEALCYDVATMKKLGFNTLRKHIKVEPLRWYYHCDKIGMLVWQDMPSGGSRQHLLWTLYLPFAIKLQSLGDWHRFLLSRTHKKGRRMYYAEYREMLDLLYNCPCIATWVPFNEGWGQFDTRKVYRLTKQLDPTRHVDHASGWHDQKIGDFKSLHVYYRQMKIKRKWLKRAVALSEFGGYCLAEQDHLFNPDESYGYTSYPDKKAYSLAVANLFERDVVGFIDKGLTASVYTQVSDVEDEINGILTFDRQKIKIDEKIIADVNKKVKL